MGIKRFIAVLFIAAVLFLLYDIESITGDINKQEKPLVSFYDTLSYTIDTQNVKSIVRSNEVYLYDKREEMVNTTMLLRDKSSQESNFAKADFVTKVTDDLYLDGNVILQAQNGIELSSEELQYNTKKHIAKNNLAFEVDYNGNIFKGEKLFLDFDSRYIKGKNIQFSLKDFND